MPWVCSYADLNLNPSLGVNCLISTPEHGPADSGKSRGRHPVLGHYPSLSHMEQNFSSLLFSFVYTHIVLEHERSIHTYDT